MDHQDHKTNREKLGLSPSEAADLLEVDVSSVYKWERDPDMSTARPAPARVGQLYQAYLLGFRPEGWPERLSGLDARRAEIDEVRT